MQTIKKRDYYFDNAKSILIFLVIFGHLIGPAMDKLITFKALYIFIYTFHMPVFILIAGYFSKKEKSVIRLINTILKPYIIFQLLYYLLDSYLFNNPFEIRLFITKPYWILWFMCSLFLWKLLLPYFKDLKYPATTMIIIAVISGYLSFNGYYFSFLRTVAFFPFFLIGYHLKRDSFTKLFSKTNRILAGVVLIGTFFLIYYLTPNIDPRWLYGSVSYELLDQGEWYAGIYRIAVYVLSLICSLCFLVLVPEKKHIFTKIGTRTLSIYLFHGFFIKLLVYSTFYELIKSPVSVIYLLGISLIIYVITSRKPFYQFVKSIVSIDLRPLYEKGYSLFSVFYGKGFED